MGRSLTDLRFITAPFGMVLGRTDSVSWPGVERFKVPILLDTNLVQSPVSFDFAVQFFLAHGYRVLAACLVIDAGESDFHLESAGCFQNKIPANPILLVGPIADVIAAFVRFIPYSAAAKIGLGSRQGDRAVGGLGRSWGCQPASGLRSPTPQPNRLDWAPFPAVAPLRRQLSDVTFSGFFCGSANKYAFVTVFFNPGTISSPCGQSKTCR